jgi:hypothetical protein
LPAVRDCLFNIFAATLHILRHSPPFATWERAMPWWQGGWGGQDMWHAWWKGEQFAGFWLGGPKGRDN